MRPWMSLAVAVGLLPTAACVSALAGPRDSSFQAFLPSWESAQYRFINGDPTAWSAITSDAKDVTIFGAFGGSEKGSTEVRARYVWASSQFKKSGSGQKIDYLTIVESGDLAVTIAIERQTAWIEHQSGPSARALRVTQVFRRENGQWKLLHRHADPNVERLPPEQRR
jgi:ketosteroid isomerase-like protein